jgi:hypothetical protein
VLAPADGGHFDIIAPGSKVWPSVETFIIDSLLERIRDADQTNPGGRMLTLRVDRP